MMKKIILLILFSLFVGISQAQNIQLLNGIGSDKSYTNFITFELYKPLEHGVFYGFADLKVDKYGYFDSYVELFKYWNITEHISLTGQVNTGVFTYKNTDLDTSFRVKPVLLFGVSESETFGKWNLSLDALWRIDTRRSKDMGVQLTGTFVRDSEHFQLSGYCDVWTTGYSLEYNKNRNPVIVQFEPQFWWKFSKRVFLGVETRISNFNDPILGLYAYSSYCMVGLKWNLEN